MTIEVTNAGKQYRGFQLSGVTFSLPEGYLLGLIGQNGAGKTTLLKILMGLYPADTGEVKLFGKEINANEVDVKNEIGWVMQENLFDGWHSLKWNRNYYGAFYRKYDESLCRNYLERFGLSDRQHYRKLSKGEKLKFQMAFALSHDPKLLILDEPTANFDPEFRREFFHEIEGFLSDGKRSVILATHLTKDLELKADYLLYLKYGRMEYFGDIETFRDERLSEQVSTIAGYMCHDARKGRKA